MTTDDNVRELGDARKLAEAEGMAAKQFPAAVPVTLPPVGSISGPVRVLSGTDPEGQGWVRIIATFPGNIAVLDFPVTVGLEHPAEGFAEMVRDAAVQQRTGIVMGKG